MFLNAVSPYDEIIKYEIAWANNKNSSLKNLLSGEFKTLFPSELEGKIEEFIHSLSPKNFSILVQDSAQFPKELRNSFIKALYYQGDIGILDNPVKKISIVGARKATQNGLKRAEILTEQLLEKEYIIVSGLASGIDTIAMQTTVNNGGYMIGVIGTPLNRYYPKENKELQLKTAKEHLLLSHVPFYKYSVQRFDTQKFYFPERNKIMAAISDATVIVEASDTSGSLTQARACLEMGKKLFILNSCFESGVKWAGNYEKKGAIRVRNIDDILRAFNENDKA